MRVLLFNQPINQNPMMPRRRWGTSTDASAVLAAHRRLSSGMRSNGDIDWSVHSFVLSFHELCGLPLRCLPSMQPCSMIFSSISWWQTWPNHDYLWGRAWRMTAEAPEVRLGCWPAAKRIRSFYALCIICRTSFYPSIAYVFKCLDSPFQLSHYLSDVTSIEEHWQVKWL